MSNEMRKKSLAFIDLFAGLGGFHLALKGLGHRCVFACELDKNLRELYENNFGIAPKGDIRKISIENDIPKHDILCAGFPCQPFSKAGDQVGFEDPDSGDNFSGILLIDEVDLYLHPEWQKKLVEIIRWLLPNSQIITTTHSPHVIQSAKPGEIIPLGISSHGEIYIRDLPDSSEFGYQGWTIEEILTDVMGLQETRSEEYKNTMRLFDKAMDNEDVDTAVLSYNRLENMLHPGNPSLKILRLQLASLGGLKNDKDRQG